MVKWTLLPETKPLWLILKNELFGLEILQGSKLHPNIKAIDLIDRFYDIGDMEIKVVWRVWRLLIDLQNRS